MSVFQNEIDGSKNGVQRELVIGKWMGLAVLLSEIVCSIGAIYNEFIIL